MFIDIGPKIQYFLLCDSLPEERWLREDLQRRRLVSKKYYVKYLFGVNFITRPMPGTYIKLTYTKCKQNIPLVILLHFVNDMYPLTTINHRSVFRVPVMGKFE